jgi:uncharacterized protein (DUF2236 family)
MSDTGLPFSFGPLDAAVVEVRRRLQDTLRTTLVGDQQPLRDLSQPLMGDTGWFGPDSVTWKVHQDSSMLLGGVRALLLQTMHPRAMAGVAQHSAYKSDPTGRLWRTAGYVGTVTYGTTEQAEAAIRMVNRAHKPVHGTTSNGESYSANDGDLKLWIHMALTDSFLMAYRRFGADRLRTGEADAYLDEQALLAQKLKADPAPRSVSELNDYFGDLRKAKVLYASEEAKDAAKWLLRPPLPAIQQAPYWVLAAGAVGSLPAWVRLGLRLPILPLTDRIAVRPAVQLLTRTLGWAMTAPTAR